MDVAAEAPSGWKTRLKRWFPTIRIVASLVMIAILIAEFDPSSLGIKWRLSTLLLFLGGMSFTILGIVLSAVRWHRVLVAMDLKPRLWPLIHTYLASQFLSNFLPSSIGGDALRVTRLSANSEESRAAGDPEAPTAFASVVLDRMSGWLILPLLCLAGLAINPALLHLGRSSRAAIALSVVTLGALGVVVWAASSAKVGGRLAGHENWLRFMGAVHLGLARILKKPRAALQVVGASILYQLAIVGAGYLAARAIGIHIGPTVMLAFIPAVAIIQVLPISIGGLGLREGAFAVFLHPLGVATTQAIALGLCMYGMHLVASLLGAPSFAVGRRPPKPAPAPAA